MGNGKNKGRVYVIFAGVLGLVVVADQVTKHLISSSLLLFQSKSVSRGWLNLVHVHNTGVAFGFFDGASVFPKTIFFSIITLIAVGIVLIYLKKSVEAGKYLQGFPLGLICGGAVGNLIDRFRIGAVVDFIDVYYKNYHWPAFNVADAAISVGVIFLILQVFFDDVFRHKAVNQNASGPVSDR
jgi:signal peptidase II